MQIALLPHTGITCDGREVTHQQDQIFVDGKRYGYVPHGDNPPLLWIRPPSAAIKSAVEKAVKDRGDTPGKSCVAAPITSEERLDEVEGLTTKRARDDE